MKKRTKKYRPREVKNPPLIYDVIASPEVAKRDLDDLETYALMAARRLEDGKGTDEDIATLAVVIDHAFVAAAAFNEKYDLRLLCLLATAALMAAKGDMKLGKTPHPCLVRIIREAVRLHRELMNHMKRSELVSVGRTANKHYKDIRVNPKSAFILDPDSSGGEDLKKYLINCVGITFVNGACRTGYLSYDESRDAWLWVMPKQEMQAVIKEPIFVLFVEDTGHEN